MTSCAFLKFLVKFLSALVLISFWDLTRESGSRPSGMVSSDKGCDRSLDILVSICALSVLVIVRLKRKFCQTLKEAVFHSWKFKNEVLKMHAESKLYQRTGRMPARLIGLQERLINEQVD